MASAKKVKTNTNFLDSVSYEDKRETEDLTIVASRKWLGDFGSIFITETGERLVKNFGVKDVEPFDESFILEEIKKSENSFFTICCEGPLITVWKRNDEVMISNSKNIDCRTSFWGDKNERFGDLFLKFGGQVFIDKILHSQSDLAHNFMITTPKLVTTSRVDLRDNECIVSYLGSLNKSGDIQHPLDLDPSVFYFSNSRESVFPLKEELKNRIFFPTRITFEEAKNISIFGYDTFPCERSIDLAITNGEQVIFRYGSSGIIKFTPKCQELRNLIAGETPNVKNRFYRLIEELKDVEVYKEKIPLVGVFSDPEFQFLLSCEKKSFTQAANVLLSQKERSTSEVDINNEEHRLRNLALVCTLSCPLSKIDLFINSFFDFKNCRTEILKFFLKHHKKIRDGGYDELLEKFHQKALKRIKDIARVSKIYASDNSKGYTYKSRMDYSLKGLLKNEHSPSIYRIEKAIDYIRSEGVEMEE